MPLKQTRNTIENSSKGMSRIETELVSAMEHKDEADRQIKNARARLKRKNTSVSYPNKLAQKLRKDLLAGNLMELELISRIDQAIETNSEFERTVYREHLYTVARNKEIYLVQLLGEGWNTFVNVQILFESVAGDLSDWARGIIAYRKELKVKEGDEDSDSGLKATRYWEDEVHGGGLEVKTVNARLAHSGKEAPYWQILNSGSQPLASDRLDGTYNPIPATPTDFIGDAERSIRVIFTAPFLTEKFEWFEEAKALEKEIQSLEAVRDGYVNDIRNLRTEVELNEAVFRALGKRNENVDRDKLTEAIRKYRAGEEFERPTIELTRAGAKKRVRVSVGIVEGLIDLYD